jgi:ubiquitin C-terminal hydrolase
MNGLANLGATCYINTIVTCLSNCKDFVDFIISKIEPDTNKTNIIIELRTILNELCINNNSIIPRRFISSLRENIKEINIHEQNDINEFLAIFIDKLNKCICSKIKVTKDELYKLFNYKDNLYDQQRERMDNSWFSKIGSEYSGLIDIFYGQNISQIICGKCEHIHHNYEIYFNLMTPIEESSKSLYDCLDHYFLDESLNNQQNDWRCDECKTYNKSTKTSKLWRNPKVLVISLKRFTYDLKKNNKSIDIPINLDISKYSLSRKNNNYKLKSVAMHYGNLQGGHYYSICEKKNKWYEIDDLDVKETSQLDIIKQGYVFFYCLSNE